MTLIEILKEWSGIALVVGGSVYGLVKYINDFRNAKEGVKQNQQHTKQERLATEEKTLDLDSRRVKASEEVASEALEDMAETRRENLKLLESDYEKSKAIIEMQAEIKGIKAYINRMEEERRVLCWFFCRKAKVCVEKEPVFGPFQLDVATLETLKQLINNEQNS
jgi:hypothetical protein